jgi:hypothetical protein
MASDTDQIDEILERKLETLLISQKHGKTSIGTLRKTYGYGFAPHCAESDRLGNVLHKMDVASLTDLTRDHKAGKLKEICRR